MSHLGVLYRLKIVTFAVTSLNGLEHRQRSLAMVVVRSVQSQINPILPPPYH